MPFNRSSFALQFSVEELISKAYEPVRYYTLTIPKLYSWREFGMRHRELLHRLHKARTTGEIPPFAGVRVFEEGEERGRPHAHWVVTPMLPRKAFERHLSACGFGHLWLDPRPASVLLGKYLCKYISKGTKLSGVRRWSCFGDFDGVKTHDIELSSPAIELFKSAMKYCKEIKGLGPGACYAFASWKVNLSKFDVFEDTMAGVSHEHNFDADYETYTYWNEQKNSVDNS